MAQLINPYQAFYGASVPNWLMRRVEVSPGAKLCYGRLMQYAGTKASAHPSQAELAAQLGVQVRQLQLYLAELSDTFQLIDITIGLGGRNNTYRFLGHPWIEYRERHRAQIIAPTSAPHTAQDHAYRGANSCAVDAQFNAPSAITNKEVLNHKYESLAAGLSPLGESGESGAARRRKKTPAELRNEQDRAEAARVEKQRQADMATVAGLPPGRREQLRQQAIDALAEGNFLRKTYATADPVTNHGLRAAIVNLLRKEQT